MPLTLMTEVSCRSQEPLSWSWTYTCNPGIRETEGKIQGRQSNCRSRFYSMPVSCQQMSSNRMCMCARATKYNYLILLSVLGFFYPHPRTCLLILERERKGERKTSMWERSMDHLPPVRAPYVPQPGIETRPRIKLQPFAVQDDASTNWATWPGLSVLDLKVKQVPLEIMYCV